MTWQSIEHRIKNKIVPPNTSILKSAGNSRRRVVSNDGKIIAMETGVKTSQTKTITYSMIEFAYNILLQKRDFDSTDFRSRFQSEYDNAPCIYSMVGGILVELGVARRMPKGHSCYYEKI